MTAPIEFTSKSKRVKALITTDGAVAIKDNTSERGCVLVRNDAIELLDFLQFHHAEIVRRQQMKALQEQAHATGTPLPDVIQDAAPFYPRSLCEWKKRRSNSASPGLMHRARAILGMNRRWNGRCAPQALQTEGGDVVPYCREGVMLPEAIPNHICMREARSSPRGSSTDVAMAGCMIY